MLEATDYRVPDRPDPVAQAYAAAEEIARQLGLPQDDWERKGWLRHSRRGPPSNHFIFFGAQHNQR